MDVQSRWKIESRHIFSIFMKTHEIMIHGQYFRHTETTVSNFIQKVFANCKILNSSADFFWSISENQLKIILIEIWKWHSEHSLLWEGWKICFSVFWEFCSPLVECKENLQGKYFIFLYYSIMFYLLAE